MRRWGTTESSPTACSQRATGYEALELQRAEDLVEQVRDRLQQPVQAAAAGIVEQTRDRTKQIPEQVARSLLGRDLQVNLVQIDHQAQQVEVQRAENQVENVTRSRRLGGRGGRAAPTERGSVDRGDRGGGRRRVLAQRAAVGADRSQDSVDALELRDVERAGDVR